MNSWTGRSKDGGRQHALRKDLRHRRVGRTGSKKSKKESKYRTPRDKSEKFT